MAVNENCPVLPGFFVNQPEISRKLARFFDVFIEEGWSKLGMKPTMHLSNRLHLDSKKGPACAHSDYFYDSENWKVLYYLERGWDIEMEAKHKLPATKGFVDSLINMNKIYLENKI